ncbi:MAG: tetratricopeptide repeat protein, partial [Gemmatimonadota bacterium]
LVQRDAGPGRESRYRMLETIREFGLQEVRRAGEEEACHQRLISHWTAWVVAGECHYCTPSQGEWLERLDLEHDNLRGALDHSIGASDPAAVRLAAALWTFWWMRGHLTEGRRWLQRALTMETAADVPGRARALLGAGALASCQGDHVAAIRWMEESLSVYRQAGEMSGVALALQNLGLACRAQGDVTRTAALFEEALMVNRALPHPDPRRISTALEGLGTLAATRGEWERARTLLEESLVCAGEANDACRIAHIHVSLGDLARSTQEDERAAAWYEKSLTQYRELRQTLGMAESLAKLGDLARRRGDLEPAREFYSESLGWYCGTGYTRRVATNLVGLGAVALAQDLPDRAARLLGGVDALLEATGVTLDPAEAEDYAAVRHDTQDKLGPSRFGISVEAGRALSLDQVLTLALQLAAPGPRPSRRRTASGG